MLTNDGKLAHNLLSPKKGVPKTYYAHIEGIVTEEDTERFLEGVILDDGYETKPGQLAYFEICRHFRNRVDDYGREVHQVKRMFEAVGKKVVYLKRLSMGPLSLDESLALGSYRELTEEELATYADFGKIKRAEPFDTVQLFIVVK